MARGDVHHAFPVEGNGRGVHHLSDERHHLIVCVDLENRYRNFLAARSGKSYVKIAFMIESGIGDGIDVAGDGGCDFDGVGIADVSVGTDDDRSRGGAIGHAGDHEIVGADQDRAFDLAKADAGAAQFGGAQAFADDAHLAAGQSEDGRYRLDVRFAVDGFLAQQTVGNAHELTRGVGACVVRSFILRLYSTSILYDLSL